MADTLKNEVEKRRTFAIISHPDAGKTTLTEKFLLYGGAINLAGSVKGRKAAKHAVSDWMEIEKERGISVTSSVLQFNYDGFCINILDTPGHQDFSEDTYRTLMAADSAVMVIDGSKGVEAQTIKLFKVCVMRGIPIFTFINKMDREAMDPFELMDQIENVLGIRTCPINWPIGSGKNFKGVYDRNTKTITRFIAGDNGHKVETVEAKLGDAGLDDLDVYKRQVFSGATLAGSYLLSPIVDDLTNCANQVMKAAAGERADLIAAGTLRLLRGVLIMLVVYGVGVVANYAQQRIMIGVSQRALIRIRKDLFDHLQEMPVRYFDTNSTGDIMSRFTNDVDMIGELLNNTVIQLISGTISAVSYTHLIQVPQSQTPCLFPGILITV